MAQSRHLLGSLGLPVRGPFVASKEAGDAMSVDTGSGAEAGVAWGPPFACATRARRSGLRRGRWLVRVGFWGWGLRRRWGGVVGDRGGSWAGGVFAAGFVVSAVLVGGGCGGDCGGVFVDGGVVAAVVAVDVGWLWLAVPILLVCAKLTGLYDRDETLLRKTTLDEAPKLFQLATLCALVAWLTGG